MNLKDMEQAIDAAVAEGVSIRSKFLQALSEPDGQALGELASAQDLLALESLMGHPVPPSYATFLRRHGKWDMFDPTTDLLPIQQVIREASSPSLRKWRQIAIDTEGISAENWILIGKSKTTASKYFIDPDNIDADGEMRVYEHDKILAEEYPNFLACLIECNKQYQEGLDDINTGGDFDFSQI